MRRFPLLPLLQSLVLSLGLAACAAPVAAPPQTAEGCTLSRRADLPLVDARNFMLAPVRINHHTAQLVVDTGAETSLVTPQAAHALALPRAPGKGTVLLGISGAVRTENVLAHEFVVGDTTRTDKRLGLGAMPSFPHASPPVIGLLGADVLAQYDIDLDLPNGRMALYAARGCTRIMPWPGAVSVPIARTRSGLAFVDVLVNGTTVRALLDTGARTTLLARETAARLGLTPAVLARDPARVGVGIGLVDLGVRQHRFAELGLPGAIDHDVPANIADLRLPGIAMLLGADYLGRRRVWISYATDRLYFR